MLINVLKKIWPAIFSLQNVLKCPSMIDEMMRRSRKAAKELLE